MQQFRCLIGLCRVAVLAGRMECYRLSRRVSATRLPALCLSSLTLFASDVSSWEYTTWCRDRARSLEVAGRRTLLGAARYIF